MKLSEKEQVTVRNIRQTLALLREINRAIQRKKYEAAAEAASNATSKLSFLADFVAHHQEAE